MIVEKPQIAGISVLSGNHYEATEFPTSDPNLATAIEKAAKTFFELTKLKPKLYLTTTVM